MAKKGSKDHLRLHPIAPGSTLHRLLTEVACEIAKRRRSPGPSESGKSPMPHQRSPGKNVPR